MRDIVVFRGGGDVATGSIQKVKRAGFNVLVLESKNPTAVRRTVSICEAVYDGYSNVEDISAVLVKNKEEIYKAFEDDKVAVLVDEKAKILDEIKPIALVDAIIAKRNIGTTIDMAPTVIALGPGFSAGIDCDIVIETNRGHNLSRLIFEGQAEKNTGNPGNIEGYTTQRVLYSPDNGRIKNVLKLGDFVEEGQIIAYVNDKPVKSKLKGMIRGLIRDNSLVKLNMKIGDVDPRRDRRNLYTISDKARAIGGGTLEAILIGERNEKSKN